MSLRLMKPGLPAAALVYPRWHKRAGEEVEPLGTLPSGKVVWPVIGGAEEQDDPEKAPGDEDDEDDEEDEDDEDNKKSSSKKSKKDEDDEEDDDDEDEDDKDSRPHRQAARYRIRAREAEKANRELRDRLKALEDKDKKPDEIASRDLTEARAENEKLRASVSSMTAQLAFFRANTIQWVDPSDAFALADREGLFEDVVDEDGNVDARELRRGLRDLAKRKPHLVKKVEDDPKGRARKSKDENDEDEDDDEQSSGRTKPMNSRRRGTKDTASRAALAKRFPVLGR